MVDSSPIRPRTAWMTVAQLAEHLALSRATVYNLVEARRIPHRRVGGGPIRFSPADVEAIEAGRGEADDQSAAAVPIAVELNRDA